MSAPVLVRVKRRIAFVAMAHPPVNGLSHAVRVGLFAAFTKIAGESEIDGVVLHGKGRCFSAGGDIGEFGSPLASADPGLSKDVHPAIERCGKTVVAAMHGYTLGGGLETALACHYRVATPDTRLGLPEVRLGLIPLSGVQRLPRLIGAHAAIDMILHANYITAAEAPPGLVDAIGEQDELLELAAELAAGPAAPLARDLPYPQDGATALARARDSLAEMTIPSSAAHALDAMEGPGIPFEEGLRRARAIYDALKDSSQAREAREAFFGAPPATVRT